MAKFSTLVTNYVVKIAALLVALFIILSGVSGLYALANGGVVG